MKPESVADLSRILKDLHGRKSAVDAIDLGNLNRVLEYNPEDLTVTVESGMRLADLQALLAAKKQWLPLDPPFPTQITLADLINLDLAGPRQFGYGRVRDYLIGLKVALGDGRLIYSGAKVVKSVAGYDLAKLFVGAKGTLGIPVECTFKLLPKPEEELILALSGETAKLRKAFQTVWGSLVSPMILDFYSTGGAATMVVGFAGTREDIQWQQEQIAETGVRQLGDLAYMERFDISKLETQSVRSSDVFKTVEGISGRFLAHAGNGIIYSENAVSKPLSDGVVTLMKRAKAIFDPHSVFPQPAFS